MPLEETYSPLKHRIEQAIRYRAVHPDEGVPPCSEILLKFSQPPDDLVKSSKPSLKNVIAAGNVKKGNVLAIQPEKPQ